LLNDCTMETDRDHACGIEIEDVIYFSSAPEETYALGRQLGERLVGGEVIALIGELGSGKTCFTQGLARGLEVPESYPVVSPTFTLVNEYPGRVILYHIDLFRLAENCALEDLGFEDYLTPRAVVVIEWAEKAAESLPEGTIFVLLSFLKENRRKILITRDYGKISKV